MKKIKLIEVKSEIAAGTRGASLGPDALKIAALNKGSKLFKQYPNEEVPHQNHLLLEDVDTPYAKYAEGVVKVYEAVSQSVAKTIEANEFPLVLAADHASAGGTIAGIRRAFPDKRLGVVWVDAHADLHTPYTTPSGNMHGMPLATAIATDNLDKLVNEVSDKTTESWEQLKNIGGISPKIKPHDLVFIGVRSTEAGEDHLMEKYNIRNFKVEEVKGKGADAVAVETLKYLADCDLIYVSFDVDSMDPSISRGTGTPVENGLSKTEAGKILNRLLATDNICCFEIVEVNPTLDDKCNTMAETTFDLLESAVAVLEK